MNKKDKAMEAFEENEAVETEATEVAEEEISDVADAEVTEEIAEADESFEADAVISEEISEEDAEVDAEDEEFTSDRPFSFESDELTMEELKALTPPKKVKGMKIPYERRKALYGYGFISIWIIGSIYFFIIPLIKSLVFSFHNTKPQVGYMEMEWVGLGNYIKAFRTDTEYTPALIEVLQNTALRLPLIIIFSIFVAVILNQKFRGRTFSRAVFFLPVIIATGPVINIINGNMDTGGYSGGSEQFSTMFETDLVEQLMVFLGVYNINEQLTTIIQAVVNDIFDLVWNSGIQILIFLAALQNIPHSAKEAAQMEGATGWEYFWKITIPYISPMILTNIVYTIVDSFTDPGNSVMNIVLSKASSWEHGYMAAMAWAYFLIIAVALVIIVAVVNKFVYYEVE